MILRNNFQNLKAKDDEIENLQHFVIALDDERKELKAPKRKYKKRKTTQT